MAVSGNRILGKSPLWNEPRMETGQRAINPRGGVVPLKQVHSSGPQGCNSSFRTSVPDTFILGSRIIPEFQTVLDQGELSNSLESPKPYVRE